MALQHERASLKGRPGIFMVGSSNVGKRTLLSGLLSVDFEDASDSSSEILCYGWTINTKYYSADVSVWMAHLDDSFSIEALPISGQLVALVMVFDVNDLSSFTALQDWVSHTDIQKFDILLCIGNKVDLLPDHFAHAEYRRSIERRGESFSDPHPEFLDYGIYETEGSSLLGDKEPSVEVKRSCLEWCSLYNIEYMEACASNADFDKCLSVDGDSQGIERLHGALSAHMWPGMILTSGKNMSHAKQDSSEDDEESDYEIGYEILSGGSAEPWDDTETDQVGMSANGKISGIEDEVEGDSVKEKVEGSSNAEEDKLQEASTSESDGVHFEFEDLTQLMSEIGNMRDNLRLMPDFQRREMAANLALKMASMFGPGDTSDDDQDTFT